MFITSLSLPKLFLMANNAGNQQQACYQYFFKVGSNNFLKSTKRYAPTSLPA